LVFATAELSVLQSFAQGFFNGTCIAKIVSL